MGSSGTQETKPEILSTYAAHLGGTGTLPGGYEMKIDESATPVVLPPRRIPYMLKDKVKAELCQMEEMGIITKAGKPTEWVNPIVVVRKPNGDVCICLDPVDLNKAVKREHYLLKRVEEVAASMSEEKVSQPLIPRQDSTRSSWSKKVLGLLRSTHPLAILVWYQPQSFFKGPCLRCLRTVIVDDLLVWGKNIEDHGHTLKQVLKRAEENDLTIDSTSGFYQIKLVKESTWLTTFNTPFGHFGLVSAPEFFQRAMSEMFEDSHC